MRVLRRLSILVVFFLLGAVLLWATWQGVKERYITPWLGEQLAHQVEKRFGFRLIYRSLMTNVFTETHLYTVRLEPRSSPGAFSTLAILADDLHFTYTPLGLLRGQFVRLDVDHCRVQLGRAQIALSVSQTGDLMTIACPPQRLLLNDLHSVFSLPVHFNLQGFIRLEGEWLLKNYQPHLMQVRLSGRDLKIRSSSAWNARVDSKLELNGPASSPSIEGAVTLNQATWRGEGTFPVGAALGAKRTGPLDLLNRFPGTITVQLNGENLWIQTDQIHAKVRSDLVVRKEKTGAAQLVGSLQALGGTYTAKRRRFDIRSGTILFPEKGGDPRLEALLETRVKRYKIFANVEGTLDHSELRLSSKPELSHEDILALLTFERTLGQLDPQDREELQLTGGTQALNLLFLGRAETVASRLLRIDEVNVNVAPNSSDGTSHSRIESVELGKYVVPYKVFGIYKLEPGKVTGETPKHSLGADYQFTDSLAVGLAVKGGTPPEQKELVTPEESRRKLEAEEATVHFRWRF